jgi:chromosome segregation ATPase
VSRVGCEPQSHCEFVSLLDGTTNNQQEVVSIQSIDRIFEERKQKKIELEEEIRSLESKIQMLQLDKSSHEGSLLEIVQQKRNVELDLKWKTDLRYELERKGLQFDDPLKLVEATRFFKDSGADEKCWKDFQTSRKWRMPSTVSTIK